ncbi:hypothetical protein [Tahibacter harae]|uniref:Dolichyl-phosphate-mannose-protein mannosyltransferase n=1 Tax=Tahibacter harae TaxID=2963937 RepID=A0ABT1QXF5_9GAMM|nr:hypothetical protein [Tahibacter harae]MCQ4166975.1 hypothetical protein [Tahibacter harae]
MSVPTLPVPALRRSVAPALFWLWAFAAHALTILLFSHPLPIADQWDTEGMLLFVPWVEGNLPLELLFGPHNEHRVFTKRVFDLLVFTLNGQQWDNQVLALANTAIYATTLTLLFGFVRSATQGLARRVLPGLLLLLPLLPFNYENTLWGFQSQFYFCFLFSVIALLHLARRPQLPAWGLVLLGCSLAALFSLASGVLLAATLALLVLLDRRAAVAPLRRYGVIALLLAVLAAGLLLLPHVPTDAVLKAQSLGEALSAVNRLASWPLPLLPLAWLPLLIWLGLQLKQRRRPETADVFFFGLAVWVLAQIAATAYGRGHTLTSLPSRYLDSLSFGVLANAYFACRLAGAAAPWPRARRLPAAAAAGAAGLAIAAGLGLETVKSVYLINQFHDSWQAREWVTAALVRGEAQAGDNPMLPYPHIENMPRFFSQPSMRRLLGIQDGRYQPLCARPDLARLSRAVCALQSLLPASPLPQFEAQPPGVAGNSSDCSLDLLAGLAQDDSLVRGAPLRFAGWVGPTARSALPPLADAAVVLVGNGAVYAAPSRLVHPRLDVARHFRPRPGYFWTGFSLIAGTQNVQPGDYAVWLRAGPGTLCRTGNLIRVS